MNSFLVLKLGEVFAFARASRDILQKGREGFLEIMDEKELEDLLSANETHIGEIMKVVAEGDIDEEVRSRAADTEEKLNKMRDMYLLKESDLSSGAKIADWMGFFEGAAYVQWSVVEDEAREEKMDDLRHLAAEASNLHENLLEKIAAYVKTL